MITEEETTRECRRYYRNFEFEAPFNPHFCGSYNFDGKDYNKEDYSKIIKMLDGLKDEEIIYATLYLDGGSMMLRTKDCEIVCAVGKRFYKKHHIGPVTLYKPFALVSKLEE